MSAQPETGKSSILNLIGRYYDIQKGHIYIDGIDIRQLSKKQLRSAIGQMQQDVFIFEGDVAYNIRLNDDDITDAQVKAAAEYVNASHFIEKLPQGYHEPVTERGATFSAGERQLLSFARTLAHNPSILVMDEATANIDTETEILIRGGARKAHGWQDNNHGCAPSVHYPTCRLHHGNAQGTYM